MKDNFKADDFPCATNKRTEFTVYLGPLGRFGRLRPVHPAHATHVLEQVLDPGNGELVGQIILSIEEYRRAKGEA
jgi:hypothetical protein